MNFKKIPSGTFDLGGGEYPRARVVLTKPFYLSECPVTRAEWRAVMGWTPWTGECPNSYPLDQKHRMNILAKGYLPDDDRLPATFITYKAACEFCQNLAQKQGRLIRLPTEAEWEWACRGGTTTPYFWGSENESEEMALKYAWFDAKLSFPMLQLPWRAMQIVGQRLPNQYGLFDMIGNNMEWVDGAYHNYTCDIEPEDYTGEMVNPRWSKGDGRMLRSCGPTGMFYEIRSDHKILTTDQNCDWDVGFRIMMEVK